MPRSGSAGPFLTFLALAALAPAARSGEDPRTAETFLQTLRDRGYHDLASEYIERLRSDPSIGQPLKGLLDYHEGRSLIDEASRTTDLARRRELLDRAGARLEDFAKGRPEDATTMEAVLEIARSLSERGHLARLVGEDAEDAEKKQAKVDESRSMFVRAAEAFDRAAGQLDAAHKKLVGFIPREDPRVQERERLLYLLLDARLKYGIALYEQAMTFPEGAKERTDLLNQALTRFVELNNNFRNYTAGMLAQFYQGKCFEELGKVGEAIGIYKGLLDQPSTQLRDLKRGVHYFYIKALARRKQHALAADEAVKWLQTYDRREERQSMDGVGVYFEYAKDMDAQVTPETSKADKDVATKKIVEALSHVVRTASPFKNEALTLLRKYKPNTAIEPREIARLTFDEATTQADEARASREWDRAVALLRAAVAKAGPRQADRLDLTRYYLAQACIMSKRLPEAEIIADFLARKRSRWEHAPAAAWLGMQAILEQYTTPNSPYRTADLERFIDLAKFTAETWPDREEADDARVNLGQIHQGRGQYDQAVADFASIPERSPRRLEGQTRLGGAYWAKSRALARAGDEKKADTDAAAAEAIGILRKALDGRKAAGAPIGDAGFLNNAADLGSALTETGKVDEALATLKPIVDAQTTKTGPAFSRLMESYLLAQVQAGQVEPAIVSMRAVEQSGEGANRAQLYYKLGRLLEEEVDRLEKSNQAQKAAKTRDSFRTFLLALAESKNGQTFESLRWAAEGLLSLGAGAEAETVLTKLVNDSKADPEFMKQKGAAERLLRVRIKLAAALRAQKKFDQAASVLDELMADAAYKRYLDPQLEKGELLDAEAEAGQGTWTAAGTHWQDLAQKLSRSKPRPDTYFEAWLRAANALGKQKQAAKARQALTAVMRLNPGVGGPTMKQKYEALLATLK